MNKERRLSERATNSSPHITRFPIINEFGIAILSKIFLNQLLGFLLANLANVAPSSDTKLPPESFPQLLFNHISPKVRIINFKDLSFNFHLLSI